MQFHNETAILQEKMIKVHVRVTITVTVLIVLYKNNLRGIDYFLGCFVQIVNSCGHFCEGVGGYFIIPLIAQTLGHRKQIYSGHAGHTSIN